MKNSPLTTILLTMLVISAVLSPVFFWMHISKTRELRELQMMANTMTAGKTLASAIAPEAIEYSKTHPDMEAVLEATGLKPRAAVSTPKPPTR